MTTQPRPTGLHPDTWKRLNIACQCTGAPPPPITETLSQRFRVHPGILSDGNFCNEQQNSEPYSAIFVASLEHPSPYSGDLLPRLATCLAYQGIVVFAPMLDKRCPYAYLLAFDTNFMLPMKAVIRLMRFIELEDAQQSMPYSQSWARHFDRRAWESLSLKLRENLRDNSHVSFS